MKFLKIITVFYVFICSIFCSENINLFVADSLLDALRGRGSINANCSDAAVKLVQDDNGKLYVLKQIKDEEIEEQFLLIRDLIASHIGVLCGIPLNKVLLISAQQCSDIKIYPHRAASLHVFCEGQDLEENQPSFLQEQFSLQQRFCNPNTIWRKIPIQEHHQGLTYDVITSMAMHGDLIKIVAFDTFVGNSDRSLPNIFYDANQRHFYGIDQAAAFNEKNLPKIAYDRLNELEEKEYFKTCDYKIIEALKIYRNTLQVLHEKIQPEYVQALFEKYFLSINVGEENHSFIKRKVDWHVQNFKDNWNSTISLIKSLDKICEIDFY